MTKFTRKDKVKIGRPLKTTDKQILRSIRKTHGFLTHAAKKIGITYQCLRNRIKLSSKLQRAVDSIQEKKLDFSESQLEKKIMQGNLTAIIFHLKCKGKERGYIERVNTFISSPKNNEDESVLKDTSRQDALKIRFYRN